jgi:hypothetical protein
MAGNSSTSVHSLRHVNARDSSLDETRHEVQCAMLNTTAAQRKADERLQGT